LIPFCNFVTQIATTHGACNGSQRFAVTAADLVTQQPTTNAQQASPSDQYGGNCDY